MMNEQYRAQLEAAQASGETITVRYTRGRQYRDHFTVTGTVTGFVHRPREAEKVRVRRAGETLLTTDVPLRAITAIERPERVTTPDRALFCSLSSGPYTIHAPLPDGDDADYPWPAPMLDLITGRGEV